jgi:tRNA pseudouridine38-40 synthase
VPESIQIDKMIEGAQHLVGTHDFKSFMASGSHITDTIRTIYKVEINEVHDEIHLVFYGNGFLYNMVRILAGMLVDIGTGKKMPDDVPQIIAAQNRTLVKRTAAAGGLYLTSVFYTETALREALGEAGKNMPIVIRNKNK